MTIQDLEERGLILLKVRSGSHAYGLATETSDEDFRGIFYLPKDDFYGLDYLPQVSDATNDVVYYELGRFLELLVKANPTALELLATPPKSVIIKHSVLEGLNVQDFLVKACHQTFAGYAKTQIRKARGLNKKVHNPMPKERKSVEDFCYIITAGKSLPLFDWVKQRKLSTADLALARVDHTRGVYAVYHDISGQWAMGISSGANANDVNLSSIPKEAECLAYLSFNQDGYSVYCRNYREYWQWVEARNDARYESTLGHGQGYDAKNMMHTIRLLEMAIEIYRDERLNVHRPNRAFLLDVKAGKYSLAEVLEMAKDRLEQLAFLVDKSKLPDQVSKAFVNQQLVRLREQLY